MTAAALQDKSQALLSTLASSLLSSFSPYEVVSPSAQQVCSNALIVLASLSGEGYIKGSHPLSQSIATVISSYTVTAPGTSSNSSSLYPVTSAVSNNDITCQIQIAIHINGLTTHEIFSVNYCSFFFHTIYNLPDPISASFIWQIISSDKNPMFHLLSVSIVDAF